MRRGHTQGGADISHNNEQALRLLDKPLPEFGDQLSQNVFDDHLSASRGLSGSPAPPKDSLEWAMVESLIAARRTLRVIRAFVAEGGSCDQRIIGYRSIRALGHITIGPWDKYEAGS